MPEARTARKRTTAKPQTGPRAGAKAKAKAEAEAPGIMLGGIKYEFSDLNLGELEELETHIGLPMDAISYGSAKTISFVVWLVKRRTDANYTLDDARSISIKDINTDGDGATVEVSEAEGKEGADPPS